MKKAHLYIIYVCDSLPTLQDRQDKPCEIAAFVVDQGLQLRTAVLALTISIVCIMPSELFNEITMQALAQRRSMQCVCFCPSYLLFIQHSQCPRILHPSELPIPSRLAKTYSNYNVYCIYWQMGVPIASKAYPFLKPKSICNTERRQWQAKTHEWSEKPLLFICILLPYVCYIYLHVCHTHDIGRKGKKVQAPCFFRSAIHH